MALGTYKSSWFSVPSKLEPSSEHYKWKIGNHLIDYNALSPSLTQSIE